MVATIEVTPGEYVICRGRGLQLHEGSGRHPDPTITDNGLQLEYVLSRELGPIIAVYDRDETDRCWYAIPITPPGLGYTIVYTLAEDGHTAMFVPTGEPALA